MAPDLLDLDARGLLEREPPTPVPKATSASDRAPSSSAFQSTASVQRRTTSALVVPPGSSIVAAWMTQRAGRSPPVVATAPPSSIGAAPPALLLQRRAGRPRDRPRHPPAVQQPGVRGVGDRLDPSVVTSASRTSISAMARSYPARGVRRCGGAAVSPIRGSAMRAGWPTWGEAARRPSRSGDLGRFVLALQPLAPALDGGDELREVDLERVEDLVGVVLGAEADLALAAAGVLDDLLGGALGLLRDLLLGDQAAPGARAPP